MNADKKNYCDPVTLKKKKKKEKKRKPLKATKDP